MIHDPSGLIVDLNERLIAAREELAHQRQRAEAALAENERLQEALRIIGDWRLDKAIEHLDKLRPYAQTEEDRAWIDRFQGWLMMVKEAVDGVRTTDLPSISSGI